MTTEKSDATDQKSDAGIIEPFAELKDVEIFEAGTYRGKTYTEEDIDTMVKNFDELKAEIKPTAVIGHEENQELLKNSGLPAAGWMTSVKRVGKKLLASFKDVPRIVADLIGRGAYKRISSEIYTNYNGRGYALRRVAILGGEIPEVKSLDDISALYAEVPDGDAAWVTLSEKDPEKVQQDDRTQDPSHGKEKNDMSIDVQEMAEQITILQEKMTKMEEDSKKDKERIAGLEASEKAAKEKFTEAEQARKSDGIRQFCKDRMAEGRISPALWSLGLEQFMTSLDDTEVLRFGEGKRTLDLTPLGFVKKFLLSVPRNTFVHFGEVASTGTKTADTDGLTAADRLNEATRKIMDADKSLKYSEAFNRACQENKDLAVEYQAELAGE